MVVNPHTWQPRYTLTPAAANWLMQIEGARAAVEHTPLPPPSHPQLHVIGNLSAIYRQFIGNEVG
ncbi:MAG: hypothetical protein AB1791_19065 [Chloroflexota bacterium]